MLKRIYLGVLTLVVALMSINLFTFAIQPKWANDHGIFKSSSFVPGLFLYNHYWNEYGDRARITWSAWGMEEMSFFSEEAEEPQIGYHRSQEGVLIASVSVQDDRSDDLRGVVRSYCEIGLSNPVDSGITVLACVPRRDGVLVQLELSRPETISDISDEVAFRLGKSQWGDFMGTVLTDQGIKLPSFAAVSLILPFDEPGAEPVEADTLFVVPSGSPQQPQ